MKYIVFEELIDRIVKTDAKVSAAYDLGIDLINFADDYNTLASILLTEYYGQEGAGWIEWYIYEKMGNPELTANEADGTEICYDLKSLWEYVEKLRHAPDFLGVTDKSIDEMSTDEKIEMLKTIFGSGEA